MKKIKIKDKIFVDFIGTYASGKSTIRKALYEELKKDSINVYFCPRQNKQYFKSLEKKYFSFIFLYPLVAMKIIYYWQFNKSIKKILGRKSTIIQNIFFYKNNFKFFLAESSLHSFFNQENIKKQENLKILNFLPTKKIFFIFVDTPPETSFNRLKKRQQLKDYENIKLQKERYLKNKMAYEVLKNNNLSIIRIDGENNVKDNANIIKKEEWNIYSYCSFT